MIFERQYVEASVNFSDNEFHNNTNAMRTELLRCVNLSLSWYSLIFILASCEFNVELTANKNQVHDTVSLTHRYINQLG